MADIGEHDRERRRVAALTYARSLAPDRLLALSVVTNTEESDAITQQWTRHHIDVDLELPYSP